MNERGCRNCMWLYHMVTYNPTAPCSECLDYNKWQTTKTTHYDEIRAMSMEELAKFFGTLPCCPPGDDLEEMCYPNDSCEGTDLKVKCWLDWLKEEAE